MMTEDISSEEFFAIYRQAVFGKKEEPQEVKGSVWHRIQSRREIIKQVATIYSPLAVCVSSALMHNGVWTTLQRTPKAGLDISPQV